jgi:hypothetical protein
MNNKIEIYLYCLSIFKMINTYTYAQLSIMNSSSKWNNRILLPNIAYDPNVKYKLYTTWKADLDGRYYQAIRAARTITSEVKRIYNLM